MADHRSPRVNKALMANYQGQTVRLIAKLTTVRTQSLKRLIGTELTQCNAVQGRRGNCGSVRRG